MNLRIKVALFRAAVGLALFAISGVSAGLIGQTDAAAMDHWLAGVLIASGVGSVILCSGACLAATDRYYS